MSIFETSLPTAAAADAAGVPHETLRNWIKRYEGSVLVSNKSAPKGGGAHGRTRTFSIFSIMQFAVAYELIKEGIAPERALQAGLHFGHFGEDAGGLSRLPAMVFFEPKDKNLLTTLVLSPKGEAIVGHSVIEDPIAQARIRLGHSLHDKVVFHVMQIDPVFREVVDRLGYHPAAVLAGRFDSYQQ